MSPLAKQKEYEHYEYIQSYVQGYITPKTDAPIKKNVTFRPKKVQKKKKKSIIAAFFALAILGLYGYYVCPYNYNNYFKPLFLNRFLNRNIKVDARNYVAPSLTYLNNSYMFDSYLRVNKAEKSKAIANIQIVSEMTDTKAKLLELFKHYPQLHPSVFVWEYSTGKGFEINADEMYPSASIIKIPIAFELIRKVSDSTNTETPLTLQDKMLFSENFRTDGSGDLKNTRSNVYYPLYHLANIMIANSDNTATNMLLYQIGGKDAFNRAMRNLGLKVTRMGNWLPDLEGTNKITAREISTILYNIDNPNYINPNYKNTLKEYLGNTKNVHLIKEKLPQETVVLHKTGDIGSMLGDSGVVYTDNGKKYIVTILVKRPHNNYGARTLIQDASLLIFNDIKNL